MDRNWGTTTNTHWRGKFYQRNIPYIIKTVGLAILFPGKVISDIYLNISKISWKSFIKICMMVSLSIIITFISVVTVKYIINRDVIIQKHLDDLDFALEQRNIKYLKNVDEAYAIEIGKLNEIHMKTIELEERMNANGLRVPMYKPHRKRKTIVAERLNGTGKSLGFVRVKINQR